MKSYMKAGEYSMFDRKRFRCVADGHSQMKRCLLCDLREYGLCAFVRCQPDERSDGKAVIFRLTRKYRKIRLNEVSNAKKQKI